MRLSLRNLLHNTNPCVIHAQGLSQEKLATYFNRLVDIFLLTDPPPSTHPDLTVVTTTNFTQEGSLARSLRHLGHDRFISVGADIQQFELHLKIPLVLEAMERVETPYVLFADSHDVLVLDVEPLVDRFLAAQCDMMLNAEPFFWPGHYEYIDAVLGNPRPMVCPAVFSPSFEDRIGAGHTFRYLNSGVWIAKREFVLWLLPQYLSSPLNGLKFWHNERMQTQDQIHYRHALLNYPDRIKLDYTSTMFQTLKEGEKVKGEYSKRFSLSSLEYTLK